MPTRRFLLWPLCLAVVMVQPALATDVVSVVPNAALSCDKPYTFNEKERSCTVDPATLNADTCVGSGVAFDTTAKKCVADARGAPTPKCTLDGVSTQFDAKLKQCVLKSEPLRSSLGDFMGDCYRLHATRKSSAEGLKAGYTYKVMYQKSDSDGKDKTLTLVESEDKGTIWCDPRKGATLFDIKASELEQLGADRAGWAFGVLAVPFKYYSSGRTFGAGTSIGPYFGRRWGKPGSAYTFAVAATLGSVKGEVRDAAGNITSTPDLQAFSLATGYMWDIAKSPEVRPFKLGVFVGADWVSSDRVVQFKQNRKPWIALQIGFDFLDN